jgi:hypothetical protein
MTALNNMVGKTGHNHPGLSWHQRILASDTQNPFCALAADINRSAERVGSDSNQLQTIREAAKKKLSRFSLVIKLPGIGHIGLRDPWMDRSTWHKAPVMEQVSEAN